jgi:hypothetical protein
MNIYSNNFECQVFTEYRYTYPYARTEYGGHANSSLVSYWEVSQLQIRDLLSWARIFVIFLNPFRQNLR